MQSNLTILAQAAHTLKQTWETWFNTSDPKKCAKLQMRFEYLLNEVKFWSNAAEKEWREAFPVPPEKLDYPDVAQKR